MTARAIKANDPGEVRQQLAELAEWRQQHEANASEIADQIKRLIDASREAGISMTEVARLLGLDRTSMYRTYINGHG